MNCKICGNACVKNGYQTNGRQRFFCKGCKLSQQKSYTYKACNKNTNAFIYKLLVNSSGISDISRILNISKNTIKRRILKISKSINRPVFNEQLQSYEVDEMFTKINSKKSWITYAINRKTKEVINFVVGRKTNENIAKVINSVLLLNPKKIYTDKYPAYKTLIPKELHCSKRYQTNRIERFNLTLRTHIKPLQRKTICYSKSIIMLNAIIKIYFWGVELNLNWNV